MDDIDRWHSRTGAAFIGSLLTDNREKARLSKKLERERRRRLGIKITPLGHLWRFIKRVFSFLFWLAIIAFGFAFYFRY